MNSGKWFQFFEARPHIQREPPSRATPNFPGEDDNRHYQVLLHLHAGAIRLRLWYESVDVVLRGLGEDEVLSHG